MIYKKFSICSVRYFFLATLIFGASCVRTNDVKPNCSFLPSQKFLEAKKEPFPPLTAEELSCDWGREYHVAKSLLHKLDFFAAVTDFKRAKILAQLQKNDRMNEIEYGIIGSYFLAGKYDAVVESFEKSSLKVNPETFPPYDDLLILLTAAYLRAGETSRACKVFELLNRHKPEEAQKLILHEDFCSGNFKALPEEFLAAYKAARKVPWKAGALNAVLPGAGFLYVGQKETAVTSFLVNLLFIVASAEFFAHDMPAGGVICAGFECGWYFGGIYGAALAAKEHNTRFYNMKAKEMMMRDKIFPVMMLKYGF
jgi:tetratricopeptide (TPR) repeat protein